MNLGKQIKDKREEKNWTQNDLAEKIYVSRQTISNWEVGRSFPDIESLIRLSDLFSLTLDELIKGDEKMVDSLKKTKIWNVIFMILFSSLLLASAICLLIDFLVNNYLSWSLIVSFSCFLFGIGTWIPYRVRQEKIVKGALVISILLFPYLSLIHYLYDYGISLIYSLEIMATWVLFVWLLIGMWRLTRISIFDIVGISCFVSIVNNVFVSHLLSGHDLLLFDRSDILNMFINLTIGILFLFLARLKIISKVNTFLNNFRCI